MAKQDPNTPVDSSMTPPKTAAQRAAEANQDEAKRRAERADERAKRGPTVGRNVVPLVEEGDVNYVVARGFITTGAVTGHAYDLNPGDYVQAPEGEFIHVPPTDIGVFHLEGSLAETGGAATTDIGEKRTIPLSGVPGSVESGDGPRSALGMPGATPREQLAATKGGE